MVAWVDKASQTMHANMPQFSHDLDLYEAQTRTNSIVGQLGRQPFRTKFVSGSTRIRPLCVAMHCGLEETFNFPIS